VRLDYERAADVRPACLAVGAHRTHAVRRRFGQTGRLFRPIGECRRRKGSNQGTHRPRPCLCLPTSHQAVSPTMQLKPRSTSTSTSRPTCLRPAFRCSSTPACSTVAPPESYPQEPTVVLVAAIYQAMARAWHSTAAVEVTVPGVIEPGSELVVKNESDQPIRVVRRPARNVKRSRPASGPSD